jgi:Domain of unknown function (DUF5666)
MKLSALTHSLGAMARHSALLASLVAAITLTACGGGGGGSGGTGDSLASADTGFSQGAITGFGSIIVNGVRFDDSKARISDDDDDDSPGRNSDDLRLGMVVSVSSTGTGTATATASAISFGSELKGPVQSINGSTSTGTSTVTAGTQTLTILGQTVVVGTRTVFDPISLPGGFASIRVGNVLEVHGHLDAASNKLTATRINREDNANKYKITGNVSGLNSVSFKIGSSTINYAAIVGTNNLRTTLSNSLTVKVSLNTIPTATDTWTALRIKSAKKNLENRSKVEVEGLITDFTSLTSTFKVNGIPVQVTTTTSLPAGTTLANGVNVEVHGSLVNGTLIASRIKLEGKDDDTNEDRGIELHGLVSSVNPGSKTFSLRGLTVSFAGPVNFQKGSVANLINGANVEVKGVAAPTGTTVIAQKIKFEN